MWGQGGWIGASGALLSRSHTAELRGPIADVARVAALLAVDDTLEIHHSFKQRWPLSVGEFAVEA
jgi:hypothetical protein